MATNEQGYFRNNVHVVNHASRFALYTDTSDEEMGT